MEARLPAEPIWTLWRREKSLVPIGNQIPAVKLAALRYMD
jgi:hypothetical protein